jgi:hypothetical protein
LYQSASPDLWIIDVQDLKNTACRQPMALQVTQEHSDACTLKYKVIIKKCFTILKLKMDESRTCTLAELQQKR